MYQRNGMWWTRLTTVTGASRRVSMETRDEATARAVEAWVTELKARLDRHRILDAVVDGRLTLAQAFVLGEVDAVRLLIELQQQEEDVAVTDALLSQWQQYIMHNGRKSVKPEVAAQYLKYVQTVWPAPRLMSWLTPKTMLEALDALPVKEQTKGRYKTGFASLCKWLVRKGLLAHSPIPSLPEYAQSPARELHYEREEALALLNAMPLEQRVIEGVMWACGWEWSAIEHARAGDFNLTEGTAFARGTKNDHRTRLTVITEPEVLPWLEAWLKDKLPQAKAFPGVRGTTLVKAHKRLCEQIEVPITTLHDWRHSFAVKELKKGRPLSFVAQMLGHANTQLVQTRYGKYRLADDTVKKYAVTIPSQSGPKLLDQQFQSA